ncbi:hypothetical protein KHS38_08120 [Mucilaginibacter sp. Bleaf8]|uniref:hypothetical protein n=1 Tax=Mucilaginibacter sp. Bleaf8 TaxID=2834430 RepID=UPI001BD16834|nr:hypothetical protein [Mucilaginibacter sp. Bleaf8]MBS7564370.1 hypothetical protein [Mucilaginibacter sp. Bleaf8]
MALSNGNISEQNDFLNTNENERAQDTGNSDAAKFNADEQEQAVNDREFVEYEDDKNLDTGASAKPDQTASPLTTQGDFNEVEENMGGTTNLTLDQLKKEGDPEGEDA